MAAQALLALFEETSAPLTLRAAADGATLLDAWPLARNIVEVDGWREPHIPEPGAAEVSQLS